MTNARWSVGSAAARALAIAALLGSARAHAELDLHVTAASDYDFRGVSQNGGDAVVQVEAEYEARSLFASAFGSPVDFGPATDGGYEIDLVAGFARETPAGLRWSFAAHAYLYPGARGTEGDPLNLDDDVAASPSYGEWSAGIASERFEVTYWYSPNLYGSGETASYVDAAVTFALPQSFALELHAGHSFGHYFSSLDDDEGDASYSDFSVGLTRPLQHVDLALTYIYTRVDPAFEIPTGPFRNDPRLILSIERTFPLTHRPRN